MNQVPINPSLLSIQNLKTRHEESGGHYDNDSDDIHPIGNVYTL